LNAFRGEPVSLEIEALPNPLIYRRNAIIAELPVDGRKDPGAILKGLYNLGPQVQKRARQDNMIPRIGADEMYGSISPEDVFKLVTKVKASDRQVSVRAIADGDTRAGDPLRLKFQVR